MPQLGSSWCQMDPGGHQHSTENVPRSLWQLYKERLIFLLAEKENFQGMVEWAFLLGNLCWRCLGNIRACTLFSQTLHQSRGIGRAGHGSSGLLRDQGLEIQLWTPAAWKSRWNLQNCSLWRISLTTDSTRKKDLLFTTVFPASDLANHSLEFQGVQSNFTDGLSHPGLTFWTRLWGTCQGFFSCQSPAYSFSL